MLQIFESEDHNEVLEFSHVALCVGGMNSYISRFVKTVVIWIKVGVKVKAGSIQRAFDFKNS